MRLKTRKEDLTAPFVFLFFLGLYAVARTSEAAEDGGNVAITLVNNLQDGMAHGGTLRHHFPIIFMFYWYRLLEWLGVAAFHSADPRQAQYVTALVRSSLMNAVFGAGTVAVCYAYVKRITGKIELGLLSGATLGFATSMWLLSTCAEVSPSGRFFLFLSLYCSILIGQEKQVASWLFFFFSAMLSGLALLSHASLQFFVLPILISVLYHKAHTEAFWTWIRQRRNQMKVLLWSLLWVACLALFVRWISPYSLWAVFAITFEHIKLVLEGHQAPDLYSRHSFASLLNITAAMATVLTNWIGTTGTQTFEPARLLPFGGLSVLGYTLTLLLFGLLGYGFYWGMKLAPQVVRAKSPDPKRFYLYLGLGWCVLGASSLYASNYGVTAEHWTPVLIGAVPVVALVCQFDPRRPVKLVFYVGSAGLALVNSAQGYPYFKMPVEVRVSYAMRSYVTAFNLSDRTAVKDAVITYGLHPTYWVPQITRNRRPVVIIDGYSAESIRQLVAHTEREGGRLWVLEELFRPNEQQSRFLRAVLTPTSWEAVTYLQSRFQAKASIETAPEQYRFIELGPIP